VNIGLRGRRIAGTDIAELAHDVADGAINRREVMSRP
jgi:hypothetical protein